MDFTREPIIETIITPKDGYKLVVRSSKSTGQEEYFVDAIEVVSFGHSFFFRSLERPKAFLVPVTDYEVVEVREARLVLKNITPDRSIKIGGGKEGQTKGAREVEKTEIIEKEEEVAATAEAESVSSETSTEAKLSEVRLDKKRDRRRHYRKRRGREETSKEEEAAPQPVELNLPPLEDEGKVTIAPPESGTEEILTTATSTTLFSSLLQPPPTLISETINRYRENALFKNAFFLSEDEQYKPHSKVQDLLNEDDEDLTPSLEEPSYGEKPPAEQKEELKPESEEAPEYAEELSNTEEPAREETPAYEEEPVSEEEISSKEEAGEPGVGLPLFAEEERTVSENEDERIFPAEATPVELEEGKNKQTENHTQPS